MTRPSYKSLGALAGVLIGVLALAACGSADRESTASDSAPPVAGDGVPADAVGVPLDAGVAATCAGVSTLITVTTNATVDLGRGAINDEQYVALIEAVAVGFESLLVVDESQRGLREELEAVVRFIDSSDGASAARFEPNQDFENLIVPIRSACETNQSELIIYATSGG